MKKIIYMIIVGIFFSGCSFKQPKIPEYTITKNDSVGYFIDLKNNPMHTHMGTTIFNNFSKEYPYNWNLKEYAITKLKNELSAKGLDLVDLSQLNITKSDINNIIMAEGETWIINPQKQAIYDKLREKNVKAVVSIVDGKKVMQAVYGAFGTTILEAEGYGLYTRSMMGMDSYFAAPAFFSNIYLLEPIAHISPILATGTVADGFEMINNPLFASEEQKANNKFKAPKEFKNITKEEFEPVKLKIHQYVDKIVNKISTKL